VQGLEQYLEEAMLPDAFRVKPQERLASRLHQGAFLMGLLTMHLRGLSPGVEHFAGVLMPLLGGGALDPLDFRVDLGGFSLTGSLDRVFKDRMVRYRYARLKGRDLVAAWIHHLALNCVRAEGYPRRTLLAGLTGKSSENRKRVFYEYEPVEEGERILEALLKLYYEGLREPLHFFRNVVALCRARMRKPRAALEQARRKWEGNEWNRGESKDPHYELCFGKAVPIDPAFAEIAAEVFEPLLKCIKKA
jgi:exodeoxyribonuclease V gamma subunit